MGFFPTEEIKWFNKKKIKLIKFGKIKLNYKCVYENKRSDTEKFV